MLEVPKEKKDPKMKKNSSSVSAVSVSTAGKRRGRKASTNQTYFDKAEEKIADLKKKLLTAKADGFDVKQRQRWRNMMSAQ